MRHRQSVVSSRQLYEPVNSWPSGGKSLPIGAETKDWQGFTHFLVDAGRPLPPVAEVRVPTLLTPAAFYMRSFFLFWRSESGRAGRHFGQWWLLLAAGLVGLARLLTPGLPGPATKSISFLVRPSRSVAHGAAPVPADTSGRGMAAVWADVRRRSLFLSADRKTGTLRAGNYAQRLMATFEPTSYTVAAPTQGSAALAWQVRFTLRGIGRADTLSLAPAIESVTPSTHEGHTSYAHPGFAIDYDNTPAGVRQTFRLAERPTGPGPVAVRLHLATALHVRPAGPGALEFTAESSPSPVLRYDSLKAWDATGRVLPAHLRLDGPTALALVVDDADATYPVTIDPLASTAGVTYTGQNPGDLFATSVALVGDLNGDGYGELAIGAPSFGAGTGMVALYRGSSTGLEPTAATIFNGDTGLNFGSSVAGAGDFNGDGYGDLLIGGAGYTVGGNNAGVTYIFGGGANIFTNPYASAAAIAGFTNSRGGTAVAGVGDVNGDGYDDFATGGPEFDGGGLNNTGSLNIVFGNASLSMATTAPTAGGAANYRLGASLSGLGDTNGDGYADLVVGAPGVNSALIVRGANATSFGSFSAFYLTPPNGPSAGTSVAGPGDVDGDGYTDILLGAPVAGTSGSVFIYPGSPSLSGNSQPAVVFSTVEPGEQFGTAVSGAGDINGDGYADFVVGAPSFANTRGRVYISLGLASITTITNRPQIIEGENAGDQFGSSLSGGDANGDGYGDVVVGAVNYNVGRGRAYAYYGSPADLAAAPTATRAAPTPASNEYYGNSVASAGDVDGDGYTDVIVGAPGTNGSQGRAYLYQGTATGLATTPSPLNEPNAGPDSNFGFNVASAGDVNGDGYADVIVGAFRANNGAGRAYLYRGTSSGLATALPVIRTLNEPNAATDNSFGVSVASAGDVDGDGYGDVIIGAYRSNGNQGRAYLYRGSAAGLATTPTTLTEPSAGTGNYFGVSVAGVGDVDGDGYADVLVGAHGTSSFQGRAYLYRGSPTGLATTPTTLAAPGAAVSNSYYGYSVASAGDVNGDGYADVLVGAYGAGSSAGRAYLYAGAATGLTATPTTLTEPNAGNGNSFGRSVASAGDVDGDGYADVLVGATGTSSNQGRAYLYRGGAAGLAAPTTLTEPGAAANNSFGGAVAGVGDVDADGYGDVLVGATGTSSNQGRAYFYRGNQGTARAGALRLYDSDLTTPISISSRAGSQFGIGLVARNPGGRVRARLVWESVANGRPFANAASLENSTAYTGRGPWTALPASGTSLELKAVVNKVGRTSRVRARLEYASSPLAATGPAAGTGGPASRVRYGPWIYSGAQQLGQSSNGATPLPVELLAFTAAPEGAAVRLAWITASEKNSASFEVQRSTDGRIFATIGTVAAAGQSTARRSYDLVDAQLPAGATTLYYRLRQLDTDGTATLSPVRVVSMAAALLSVYPNPTPGTATLTGAQPGAVVQVLDALGRPVLTASADATGAARLALPAGQPAGVYLVRCGGQSLRLVVE